jgi:MFS family permease
MHDIPRGRPRGAFAGWFQPAQGNEDDALLRPAAHNIPFGQGSLGRVSCHMRGFFVLPFDVIERRGLSSTRAALVFLPFTLGLALLSPLFGRRADAIGTRVLLIVGPAGAALAYIWLALGHKASLVLGVIGPIALLGTSFAALVAPLTASVLSSVGSTDEGLASGINNALSRIAQLIGIALASGAASFPFGYEICFASAGVISIAAATTTAATLPKTAAKSGAS